MNLTSLLTSDTSIELLKNNSIDNFNKWTQHVTQHPAVEEVYNSLNNLPQVIEWHPEYDTWLHTYLVASSAARKGWYDLIVPAVFHDWGKVNTNLVKRDKISAYGHAKESARLMEKYKSEFDNFEWSQWIAERHMAFDISHKRFQQKERYDQDYDALERFEICDKQLSRALFWEFENVREIYKSNLQSYQDELNSYKNASRKIHMMVGVPGSGKTTFINQHRESLFNNAPVYSRDDIRRELYGDVNNQGPKGEVKSIYMKRSLQGLEKHGEIVLDGTHCFPHQRYKMFLDYGKAQRIGYIFDIDPGLAERRVQQDIIKNVDRANVDMKIIQNFQKGFRRTMKNMPPDEFHEVFLINTDGVFKYNFKRNKFTKLKNNI